MATPTNNSQAIVAYLLGPIYLLIEKANKELRFYALQATFLWLAVILVNFILGIVRLWFLTQWVGLAATVLWIYLVVKAYQGQKIVLPVIGELAQKYA